MGEACGVGEGIWENKKIGHNMLYFGVVQFDLPLI